MKLLSSFTAGGGREGGIKYVLDFHIPSTSWISLSSSQGKGEGRLYLKWWLRDALEHI